MGKYLSALIIASFILGCNYENGQKSINFKFELQTSKPGISIRALQAVDEHIAWISGTEGKFAKTINGGKNWIWDSIPGTEALDFRDIEANDDKTALVISAGLPAKIFKTADGGENWQEKYSDTTKGVFFNSFDFWDKNNGIAVSDPLTDGFFIIETQDGGENWSRINPAKIPAPIKGEAQFAASGSCIETYGKSDVCFVTGGAAARAFISHNRGNSWQVYSTPIIQNEQTKGIYSVAIFDENTITIVGGDYLKPQLKGNTAAISNDGGKSWTVPSVFPPTGFNSCVKYVPKTKGKYLVAVGTEGSNFSNDGGHTWQLLDTIPYHTLDFEPGGKFGWAAGSDGRVARIRIIEKKQ
ncbi:MAG: YCF48-related protein [Bacteroidales bacterium]|nr:YCF48-related protein [Bacteroidales bacterium]